LLLILLLAEIAQSADQLQSLVISPSVRLHAQQALLAALMGGL